MRACLAFAAVTLLAVGAVALPPTQSDDDSQDDARLTLTTQHRFIDGDRHSYCQLRIQISGDAVPLSRNDEVLLWVYEDDFAGDDLIWEGSIRVSLEEANAQQVDRTFDCGGRFDDDLGDNVEIYGDSEVRKEECGAFCRYDRPETAALDLVREDDDAAEDDDGSDRAGELPLGQVADRIARDHDWFAVNINARSDFTLTSFYRDAWGRLDLTMYDQAGVRIGDGVDGDGTTTLTVGPLVPGNYRVRLSPRDGGDYNYYDLEARLRDAGCQPGIIEEEPCGDCGGRRRTCQEDASWGPYGICEHEGVCTPGDQRDMACGNCGNQIEGCGGDCQWRPGACEGQGECAPGNVERDACEGAGSHDRTCDEACVWSEWSMCSECDEAAAQPCYDGPAGTAGIGECSRGQQRCVGGAWRDCEDQTLPAAEMCADGLDQDCDGFNDEDDPDCAEPPAVGDPCIDAEDCGDALTCLPESERSVWVDGYCSQRNCDDACPDEATCALVFNEQLCVSPCARPLDCRPGYICADLDGAGMGCIPRCRGNDDCRDTDWPRCDPSTGVCVEALIANDMGVVPLPDQGVGPGGTGGTPTGGTGGAGGTPATADAGDPIVGEPVGCGCSVDDERAPSPLWLMALALLGLRRRRR
jgi:MYXO-CTERM domain-containing protein